MSDPNAAAAPINVSGTSEGSAPASPGATTTPAVDWTSGFNDETKGFIQTKGFKDPSAVIDSYRNLEKMVGVPPERILKLPERSDDPAWGDVWNRLGKPKDAKEYHFDMPKEYGDQKFAEKMKSIFHEAGLPKGQGDKIAVKYNEYVAAEVKASQEAYTAQLTQQDSQLKKDWGAAYDQNISIGKKAVQSFGFDGETIDQLESAMGFAKVMKLMHTLGAKVGEDSFVNGTSNNSGFEGALTPEQAKYQIAQLQQDESWKVKYMGGDVEAREKMERLHKYAYPTEE